MKLRKLTVIPEPEPGTRLILVYTGPGTIAIDGGRSRCLTWGCGTCDSPLIVGKTRREVLPPNEARLVIRCSSCGAYNDSRETP